MDRVSSSTPGPWSGRGAQLRCADGGSYTHSGSEGVLLVAAIPWLEHHDRRLPGPTPRVALRIVAHLCPPRPQPIALGAVGRSAAHTTHTIGEIDGRIRM